MHITVLDKCPMFTPATHVHPHKSYTLNDKRDHVYVISFPKKASLVYDWVTLLKINHKVISHRLIALWRGLNGDTFLIIQKKEFTKKICPKAQ